jgi:hypothetical protein
LAKLRPAESVPGDTLSKCLPLDEFQHQCLNAVRLFKAVDPTDVGMVQGGENLRFTLESGGRRA